MKEMSAGKRIGDVAQRRPLREELEFLPAALEVVETPPSPAGHALIWLLITLFVIAVAWSIVGRIDEVAVASGKVVPSGYTKAVQAEDRGVISSIRVTNGSHVRAGDVLIELDATLAEADVARLTQELSHYTLTLRRLNAEAAGASFDVPNAERYPGQDVERQRTLYIRRTTDAANRILVADKAVAQAAAALRQSKAVKKKLAIQVKMAGEREERTRAVSERGGVSGFTWREYLEKYLSLKQDLAAQESEILRNMQALEQARTERKRIGDEREREISEQIVEAAHRLRLAEEDLKKAKEKRRLTRIVSPIDGTVQQLEVHTTGGVVTPAQTLMQVVPDGGGLLFEVWAQNRDIGFVHKGQRAEIKVETFNFQRYGTLNAVVETVATEAVEDRQRGLIYRVLLSADRDGFIVEDRRTSLIPGMAVTAEIKTRRKRVIEYFLDPFRTYVSEALRER